MPGQQAQEGVAACCAATPSIEHHFSTNVNSGSVMQAGYRAHISRGKHADLGQGRIIQIGSALAYRGIPLQSAYSGSKHAIQGFTESVRSELLHDKSNVKITMVQLPTVNTPQFGWLKSRLPHKAQPVPPIYQPEVIADAVTWVADHYRRQLYIGWSTVKVIQGNKVLPWYGDRYLAKTGYKSQQTSEPENHDRPNNLWQPVDGDHGAHGAFDARAKDKSWELWVDMHRNLLALAGAEIVSLIGTAALFRRLR
jgi:short chain dehydrogenase